MKKLSQSRIVKLISRAINVRQWFDWDRLKGFTLYLGNGFRRFFVPQKETQAESFEEAKAKFNLSEEEISIKQKALYRLSILMILCAFLIFTYAVYQIFWGSLNAFIASIVVGFIALTFAFRYHFWYFQMKQHKLGCTFKEWYRGLLGEKK